MGCLTVECGPFSVALPPRVFGEWPHDLSRFDETVGPARGNTSGGTASAALPLRNITGRCVDVPAVSQTNGTQVALWDCNGGANQQWNLQADGTVTGVQSGLCLAPAGGGSADSTPVVLSTCDGSTSHKWTRG